MRSADELSVLITGGGSGIGAGTAAYLAELGAKVTITGRREERLQEVAEAIGERCAWVAGSIDDATDREAMVAGAAGHGGGVDALVHCAGNIYRSPIENLDEAELQALFQTNGISTMMMTRAALPAIVQSKGAIVFFGSAHVQRAFPSASPYAATKAAQETLARAFAAELGPKGVRVNCLRPGSILTETNQRAGIFETQRRANVPARCSQSRPWTSKARLVTPRRQSRI